MAFEIIHSERGGHFALGDKVSIGRHGNGHMSVTLGFDLCDRLGWTTDDRVNFYWGSGPDFGLLLIKREPHGLIRIRPNNPSSKSLQASTSIAPDWMRKTFSAQRVVPQSVSPTGLTVALPREAYDEQQPTALGVPA